MSVCRASTSMSAIRRKCSRNSVGTRVGRCMPLAALAGRFGGGAWMRRSMSRMEVRYSSMRRRSAAPTERSISLACSRTKSRMLRFITSRCCCTMDVSPADCAGKQAVKNNARVDFLGRGRRRRAPGKIGLIDAAIAGVAEAILLAEIAAQFQRGKPRRIADFLGDDLIAGDGGADVVALRFENRDAGKICGHRAGVGAAAAGVGVGEVGKHQHVVFERLKRRQRLPKFKIGALRRWTSRIPS